MDTEQICFLAQAAYRAVPGNSFSRFGLEDSPIWEAPLIGLAAGDDPIFSSYKEAVGPLHWTPEEAWTAAYPESPCPAESLTVLAAVFPQSAHTLADQALQKEFPALRWAYARNTFNALNSSFCQALAQSLAAQGVAAVIPDQLSAYRSMIREGPRAPYACWSHRHAAHAAGLGTFGLSDGLITRRGKAMRCTSLILKGRFPADPRPYHGPYDWCLFYRDGSCGQCAARCPAGALSPSSGHDRRKCEDWLDRCDLAMSHRPDLDHTIEAGCGLCQAGVHCSHACPVDL